MINKTYNKGFTLMEVLVALAVLSIGLLGMAGMQLFSLKSSHNAYLRTQATTAANELVDKIRANRIAAIAGNYDSALITNCQTTDCTPNQLASFELSQWKCALGNYETDTTCTTAANGIDLNSTLPSGDGSVVRDNTNSNVITVTVQWMDRSTGNTEDVMVVTEL